MKASLRHLDPFRLLDPPSEAGATYGAFSLPHPTVKGGVRIEVIAADGSESGWDHVSAKVRLQPKLTRVPTWGEMDWVKQQFFDEDEVVIQYHINGEAKINKHHSVLHLWKSLKTAIPVPPKEFV